MEDIITNFHRNTRTLFWLKNPPRVWKLLLNWRDIIIGWKKVHIPAVTDHEFTLAEREAQKTWKTVDEILAERDQEIIEKQLSKNNQAKQEEPRKININRQEEKQWWVDLKNFLNEHTSKPSENSWGKGPKIQDGVKMKAINTIENIKINFSDKEIEQEVNKFVLSFLQSEKKDFFRGDLREFISYLKSECAKLKKIKNGRRSDDYKKLYALQIFFQHLDRAYEYLTFTLYDYHQSENDEKHSHKKKHFHAHILSNTVRRKLEIDITQSDFEDLTSTFSELNSQIFEFTDSFVEALFWNEKVEDIAPSIYKISCVGEKKRPVWDSHEYIISWVDFSDPKSIVDYLDVYAVWQEHAKEVLAVAFSKFVEKGEISSQLIVGPSWSWKTYMIDLLCKLTGYKFVPIGLANMSSAWVKWNNLKDQLQTLKGHKWKAILFFDELDKLADSKNQNGASLQNELLTLFNTDTPSQEYEGIDLKNIMIIWAWAFEDNGTWKSLHSILKKKSWNKKNIFESMSDADLIEYGLKPEIVWRMQWKTYLNALSAELLYDMMQKENSELSKITKQLEQDNIEVVFTDEALREIAQEAYNGVWARAIKSSLAKIIKPILLDKVRYAWKVIEFNKETVEEMLCTSSAEKSIEWGNTDSIIAYLDRFVPWNMNAKRALANSFREFMVHGKLSHTFIYGESWSWKTYMISLLCKAAGIEMWEVSLANVTPEGFVWESFSSLIKSSFSKWYMWKSSKKVLFLDEIDKIINRTWKNTWWNFGSDIMNELLGIFNGSGEYGWIDLSNCLIVSAWACMWNGNGETLKWLVQKRLWWTNKLSDNSLLEQVEKGDLEQYGFKTELVWRFKRVSFLESVDKNYLRRVMFESEGSIYDKKLDEAAMEGYDLWFSEGAIELILEEAEGMRTWVRALESILNKLFDRVFEDFDEWKVQINDDYVNDILNPKAKFQHPDMDKIDWSSPQKIKAYLDTKAQWNEFYKKNLSILVYKLKKKIETGNNEIIIPNMLVLGPSWGWKTYLFKNIMAPLLWIPFVETNIGRVKNNYGREKLSDVFDNIWNSVDIAMVFLDEVDKILMDPYDPLNDELMAYLEGGEYEWRSLKNFVFIWAWAFQGKGVTNDEGEVNIKKLQDIWVKTEVLGRFWKVCGVEKMTIWKMLEIFNAETSIFQKMAKNFTADYSVKVVLWEGVAEYICWIALKQSTGARALQMISETLFTDFEYNIWEDDVEKWEFSIDINTVRQLLDAYDY